MSESRIWILGAADPEMEKIKEILDEFDEDIGFAAVYDDKIKKTRRTLPHEAYKATAVIDEDGNDVLVSKNTKIYFVECRVKDLLDREYEIVDHHNPGDVGYGKPSEEFLGASSIGQVIKILAKLHYDEPIGYELKDGQWVLRTKNLTLPLPKNVVLAAASDHCLGAAYKNKCPGVHPDQLMKWRIAERAKFQKRNPEDILKDVYSTMEALKAADEIELDDGVFVKDMRREPPYPELPEAATRLGIGYISGPLTEKGRKKITVSGDRRQVEAFMKVWAPKNGLVDIYGDPARGFAGGYIE